MSESQPIQCPHCNEMMIPAVVMRGPTVGRPKCSLCGKGFDVPTVSGERPMPKTDPNDPPTVKTTTSPPTMPEQRPVEPNIAQPPTVKVKAGPPRDDPKRSLTKEEEDWALIICPRVKRNGGFCKDLAEEEEILARETMAQYGTKPEEGWLKKPHIPRYDNAPHASNQKALFEKPVRMIQVQK